MLHEAMVPSAWTVLPFVMLLGAIALGPVAFSNWWARHYPKVAFGLGGLTLAYYLLWLQVPARVFQVGHEYTSFIILIGSLFVVSGGIHLKVQGEATPRANVGFLFCGALLANLLGTTGASMLLIRPWIRMNKYRVTGHHIVFFILIVSNVGGCLTPIGDPPLFLGYLKGVPFWWVALHCWPMWVVAVSFLLAAFYLVDRVNYNRAPKEVRANLAEPPDQWSFQGTGNLLYLAVILGAVFIRSPVFLRETIMLAAAAGSYFSTSKQIHESNQFNFHPIREVAILFVGIFATMIPALDWLEANAGRVVTPSPAIFYWGSGMLSSVLDNAPTYLSFLSASFGLHTTPEMIASLQNVVATKGAALEAMSGPTAELIRGAYEVLLRHHGTELAGGNLSQDQLQSALLISSPASAAFLVAISVGSVFFGANTYIGNGPNFLVKSIADHRRIRTPGFLEYIWRFTLPVMLPMLLLVGLLFFRR